MSYGLLGFVMVLFAFIIAQKIENEFPSMNLKQMFTGSFLFWNGLILMTYASIAFLISKLLRVFA